MRQAELREALTAVCENVAYRAFKNKVEPPFICYLFTNDADVIADDENYVPISDFDVELYTDEKDPALESELEAVLKGHELVWSKNETYSEKLFEVVYSVQLIHSPGDDSSG